MRKVQKGALFVCIKFTLVTVQQKFSHFTWLHCENRGVCCGIPKCQWDTTLSQTVGRLCKQAGITGYKTNHSLRVTSATRLFQSGVDEQLIMSHTGHRSVDGVRSYKRISDEQKKAVSGILSSTCTKVNNKPVELDRPEIPKRMKLAENKDQVESVTSQTNTNMTLANLQSSNASCTPSFNFTSCSSVTINYHMR